MSMPEIFHDPPKYEASSIPFAGRLGGNQEFVLDRDDPDNASILQTVPDAGIYMTIRQSFDLRGFREIDIWRGALMEGVGERLMSLLVTIY
jgi:hypothetical protein